MDEARKASVVAGSPAGQKLACLLERARRGSVEAKEDMIRGYTPFVLGVASRIAGRYVKLGEDDEASIALIAFNEAIEKYEPERGTGFLSFAALLVKRRLVDYYRAQAPGREVPASAFEWAGAESAESADETLSKEAQGAFGTFAEEPSPGPEEALESRLLAAEMRSDVVRFVAELRAIGIAVTDLVAESPKHSDTRRSMMDIARSIVENEVWNGYFSKHKKLPLAMLEDCGLSRKTLERHRKYLVALVLALSGQYPAIRRFLTGR